MSIIQNYPNHSIDLENRIVRRINTALKPDSEGKYTIRYRGSVIKMSFIQLKVLVRPGLKVDEMMKTTTQREEIRSMRDDGLNLLEIATELGVTKRTVSKYLSEIFIEDNPEHKNSKNRLQSIRKKILKNQVQDLKEAGFAIKEIAQKLSITKRTVYNYI